MALEIPGIKLSLAVAGLFGGVVSLKYVAPLTKWQGVLAVLSGAACSIYITPLAVDYFHLSPTTEHGVAFLIGLTSMNVVPGFLKLTEKFKNTGEGLGK